MPSARQIDAVAERSSLVADALAMARAVHRDETRETGNGEVPFVDHLTDVAGRLLEHEYEDAVIAAGLLHDSVEHAGVSVDELRERFGARIAAIVEALTEDDSIEDYQERKLDLRERLAASTPGARAVFAADKAANVATVRVAYEACGEDVDRRLPIPLDDKILIWEYDLEMLFNSSPGVPLVDHLADELLGLWGQRADAHQAMT